MGGHHNLYNAAWFFHCVTIFPFLNEHCVEQIYFIEIKTEYSTFNWKIFKHIGSVDLWANETGKSSDQKILKPIQKHIRRARLSSSIPAGQIFKPKGVGLQEHQKSRASTSATVVSCNTRFLTCQQIVNILISSE